MSAQLEKIRKDIRNLSFEDLQTLAAELYQQTCGTKECQNDVEAAWDEELGRRVTATQGKKLDMISWVSVNINMLTESQWLKK